MLAKGCVEIELPRLTMVFKLMQSAAKRWRALNGADILPSFLGSPITAACQPRVSPTFLGTALFGARSGIMAFAW